MGVSFLGLNLQKATWAVVVSTEIVTGATGLNAVLGVGVGGGILLSESSANCRRLGENKTLHFWRKERWGE